MLMSAAWTSPALADPVVIPTDPAQLIIQAGPADWVFQTGTAGTPTAGVVSLVNGALVTPGQFNPVDDFWAFSVDGLPYAPGGNADQVVDPEGVTLTLATVAVDSLEMTQQHRMSSTLPVLRSMLTIRNTGAAGRTVQVLMVGDLGSDEDTVVEGTSTGDIIASRQDRWILTSDGAGTDTGGDDPTVGTVVAGAGRNVVTPTVLALVATASSPPDRVILAYNVRVPAGGTRRILNFTTLSADPAAAAIDIANFDTIEALEATGLLADLDAATRAEVVNFPLGGSSSGCAGRTGC
jgi:hypothetical protein